MRILVSRLKFIGDIILTTPVLESLRQNFPDAEIDYLGDKDAVTLLENNPNVDKIIGYDFNSCEVAEQIRVGALLRKRCYDVAIDLFGNPRSAIVILLSGAKMRIGGNFGWRGRTYTHPLTISERMTAVSFHLKYLEPLGIMEKYRQPKIFLRNSEVEGAREYLGSLGVDNEKPIVGLHVGATWPAKVWPAKNFAQLSDLAQRQLGAQVVVTYGQKDIQYFKDFSNSAREKFTAIPPRKLRELVALISLCSAYVSNDAAPMHISAAVGTPTVGIFGPGEPDIWFPYEKKLGHAALKKDIDCCRKDFCKLEGNDFMRCMKAISPEEVLDTLKQNLKNRKHEDA